MKKRYLKNHAHLTPLTSHPSYSSPNSWLLVRRASISDHVSSSSLYYLGLMSYAMDDGPTDGAPLRC
jgi:hypothetical protein